MKFFIKMKLNRNDKVKAIKNCFKENKIEDLKIELQDLQIYEIADIIEILKPEQRVVVFRLLSKEKALEVFEQIEVNVQTKLVESFADEKAIEFFKGLEPDDRIRLMDELPAAVAKTLLSSLSLHERRMTNMLMGYAVGTAGHIMTPKYIRLQKDMTVADALEKIKKSGKNVEAIYHLYITDEQRKLEGMVLLKDLILENGDTPLTQLMKEKQPVFVDTDADSESVAYLLKDTDLLAIPVVDKEQRLLGVITVDDAFDVLEEEAIDDYLGKAGFSSLARRENARSSILSKGTVFQVWRARIPYLLIALFGGLMAALLMESYEATLIEITAVAFFVPVVMDMGGNVGTQSATIFTRALILGQIDFKKFVSQWLREMFMGATMGIFLGSLGGLAAYLWQGFDIKLGFAVGLSLWAIITLATTVGYLIPYILVKLGLDQATGANPVITTIKDVLGLLIYFLLVSAILL